MNYLTSYVLIFLLHLTSCAEEAVNNELHCSKDDEICSEPNEPAIKYRSFDNLILTKINNSVNSYEECQFKNCSCYVSTLNRDLSKFKNGITKAMIENVRKRGTTYVIYKHKLYRDRDCLFPARCSGIEHFVLQLLSKLNDMELIINTRDWPQINQHFSLSGPVFSFSKTEEYSDILYPAWSFWEGGPAIRLYPTGIGRWDRHRDLLTEESKKWSWDKKLSKGFFRGSRTNEERDALILLSRKYPDLVDAQYTKNQAWKSSADTLGSDPAEEVSLEHHCRYKYLFNFRGIAASFRFKHLFLCNSLVIHVGDEWYEFFYPAMKPWVHYIPMSQDANQDDLLNLINFLQRHDDLAREIAERGRQFIFDHLRLKEVKCYWRKLLKNYQKLLKFSVELDSSLVEIK